MVKISPNFYFLSIVIFLCGWNSAQGVIESIKKQREDIAKSLKNETFTITAVLVSSKIDFKTLKTENTEGNRI